MTSQKPITVGQIGAIASSDSENTRRPRRHTRTPGHIKFPKTSNTAASVRSGGHCAHSQALLCHLTSVQQRACCCQPGLNPHSVPTILTAPLLTTLAVIDSLAS
ncbi:hypothetical protein ECG_05439 [Echinococcus granulosus]|nr:hypothetical protein ECG_05439 [Echinococcus granulosus]